MTERSVRATDGESPKMDVPDPDIDAQPDVSRVDKGKPCARRVRTSEVLVGIVLGLPLSVVLFFIILHIAFHVPRIGPPGRYWFPGKGGETYLTPLGRMIVASFGVTGLIISALLSWIANVRRRHQSKRTVAVDRPQPMRAVERVS